MSATDPADLHAWADGCQRVSDATMFHRAANRIEQLEVEIAKMFHRAADRIEELEAERREQVVRLTEMERRYLMLRHRARLINDQTQALAELLCPIESAPAVEDTP